MLSQLPTRLRLPLLYLSIVAMCISSCAQKIEQPASISTSTIVLTQTQNTSTSIPAQIQLATAAPQLPAATFTLTPTPKTLIRAISNTNCRLLPVGNGNVVGHLSLEHDPVEVFGKDILGKWLLILNPDNPSGRKCWIWLESVELDGTLESIPVVSAITK